MNSSFPLINDLAIFLDPLHVKWFVSGGWAIDIHINRITRKRCDLDISIPFSERKTCIAFFLEQGWIIEGKLFGGFKPVIELSDYNDDIHYFWSFPKEADFVSEYIDDRGNRRISYNRDIQRKLDYIEVFFDQLENGYFVYSEELQVKRQEKQAILERDGIRYLSPELVLLYKANDLSEKNQQDFSAAITAIGAASLGWLERALMVEHGDSHKWLNQMKTETIEHKCRD